MQFNGVNNKKHQRSLVDSGLLHMRLRGNSTFSLFEAFLLVL